MSFGRANRINGLGRRGVLCVLGTLVLLLTSFRADAAVDISFYTREFGARFPHAFVVLTGTLDRSGEKIDTNYGFTATHISPAILMGSVKGEVMAAEPAYVRKSDPHFSLTLSDEEYDRVLAVAERWRTAPQPSYNLDQANCVFFVAEVAAALGMKAETPKALMKKPRSYTEMLTAANRAWLQARGARFLRKKGRGDA